MRGLNENEIDIACGGFGGPQPPVGVDPWLWEQLQRLIKEQNEQQR